MMHRHLKEFLCAFAVLSMMISASWSRASAGDLTVVNHTSQTLCVYVGNNVLTCHFSPNATAKLKIPTAVIYNGQNTSASSVKVTNASPFTDSPNGSKIQSNVTLCQQKSYANAGATLQWTVNPGSDQQCSVNPVYPKDAPQGIAR